MNNSMAAKKILLSVLLTCLSYAGCKNTDSRNNKHSTEDNALKKAWYKHYSGTKDGKQIVVNLQCAGKKVQGSYYYPNEGVIIDLAAAAQGADGNSVNLIEDNSQQRPQDDSTAKDSWQLSIQYGTAKGKWVSGDKKKTTDIDMKEEYPTGTYPLDVVLKGDSKEERKEVVHVTAATFYELLQPGAEMNKADANFLSSSILHFLGGGTGHEQNISDYVLLEDKKYFDNFEKLLADMKIDREAHEDWEYNFEHTRRMKVLYNSGGMLVLQLEASERTGGGVMGSHFRSTYACIDMQQKKQWQVKDIMDVNGTVLVPLLNDQARKAFGIPNNGPLSGRLRVEDIPLTDNVYFTGNGIAFVYFPGVIAAEEEGEICLFLPFRKLMRQLRADFKTRMEIQ